ncbi:unnamed protein product, partial [Brenthis ino]
MLRIFSLLCLVMGSQSASAPFIKPCKPSDGACILASSRAAMPDFTKGSQDLGIKSLDPMHFKEIKSDHAGLKLLLKDSTIKGLKDCDLQTSKLDTSKMKLTIHLKCNTVVTGDYKLDGKLLVLPVQGEGKYSIDIRDIVIKIVVDLATVTGADGKPHWHITKFKHNFKVLTGTTFDFKNLFNGNQVLAQPVLEFANTNWKDVMDEISPPVIEITVTEVLKSVEALFKAVPIEKLVS